MGKVIYTILEKLGISTAGLRLPDEKEVKELMEKVNLFDLEICDHGYSISNLVRIVRNSPPDDYKFPVKEECVCRELYNRIKKGYEINEKLLNLKRKLRKIDPL